MKRNTATNDCPLSSKAIQKREVGPTEEALRHHAAQMVLYSVLSFSQTQKFLRPKDNFNSVLYYNRLFAVLIYIHRVGT